ncbi:L-galactose dehydrogenase-like [Chrysoperla carnea]|uniref:L-galactose dehydrogenase-like n=1 Tax=Chrysoperla carnea TaxID=189513 RepID=UPI001D07E586|nr:L-galactose dehydrogenase-like [Chrysoperla carnea]XP_044728837.1 L-galactose dehydrogenase-like [Chrysoperla carnea]
MNGDLPPTFVQGFHDEEAVRKMKYTPLGDTGLIVSQIGIGGAGFTNLYGKYNEDEVIATIHTALKSGINYIDTAPFYGNGSSEEILGKALKTVPREAYYIATKVARYVVTNPDKSVGVKFDYTAKSTLESVDQSLKLLGMNAVDIIQIHDIGFSENLDIVLNECLPTLEEVVKKGKARFIGVTDYSLSTLKECIQRSKVKISSILNYARFTLTDDALSEYLEFFKKRNVGVINGAVHQMGMLTNFGPQPWHPAHEKTKQICKQAGDYCKTHGVELGQLALYHALTKQPGPAVHLIGLNNRNILKFNLDIVHNSLSDKHLEILKDINQKFLSKVEHRNWEGVEKEALRKGTALKY